jgi:hypothetical protein
MFVQTYRSRQNRPAAYWMCFSGVTVEQGGPVRRVVVVKMRYSKEIYQVAMSILIWLLIWLGFWSCWKQQVVISDMWFFSVSSVLSRTPSSCTVWAGELPLTQYSVIIHQETFYLDLVKTHADYFICEVLSCNHHEVYQFLICINPLLRHTGGSLEITKLRCQYMLVYRWCNVILDPLSEEHVLSTALDNALEFITTWRKCTIYCSFHAEHLCPVY